MKNRGYLTGLIFSLFLLPGTSLADIELKMGVAEELPFASIVNFVDSRIAPDGSHWVVVARPRSTDKEYEIASYRRDPSGDISTAQIGMGDREKDEATTEMELVLCQGGGRLVACWTRPYSKTVSYRQIYPNLGPTRTIAAPPEVIFVRKMAADLDAHGNLHIALPFGTFEGDTPGLSLIKLEDEAMGIISETLIEDTTPGLGFIRNLAMTIDGGKMSIATTRSATRTEAGNEIVRTAVFLQSALIPANFETLTNMSRELVFLNESDNANKSVGYNLKLEISEGDLYPVVAAYDKVDEVFWYAHFTLGGGWNRVVVGSRSAGGTFSRNAVDLAPAENGRYTMTWLDGGATLEGVYTLPFVPGFPITRERYPDAHDSVSIASSSGNSFLFASRNDAGKTWLRTWWPNDLMDEDGNGLTVIDEASRLYVYGAPEFSWETIGGQRYPVFFYTSIGGGTSRPNGLYLTDGFSYQVQQSTNLNNWSNTNLDTTDVFSINGLRIAGYRCTIPASPSSPRRHLRVVAKRR